MRTQTGPEPKTPSAEQPPKRGPEHDRLEVFLGKWTAEGKLGDGAEATALDEYEWLPGGFFLLHRGVMRFGDKALESTQIISFDASIQKYRLNLFDNFGWARVYEGQVDGRIWKFTGARERLSIELQDEATMLVHWEQSDDGSTWRPLCDLKASKVQ
jgi:hypothetical protein